MKYTLIEAIAITAFVVVAIITYSVMFRKEILRWFRNLSWHVRMNIAVGMLCLALMVYALKIEFYWVAGVQALLAAFNFAAAYVNHKNRGVWLEYTFKTGPRPEEEEPRVTITRNYG